MFHVWVSCVTSKDQSWSAFSRYIHWALGAENDKTERFSHHFLVCIVISNTNFKQQAQSP
jgi:hypothetical protein